jgi:hypothetical protein
MCFPVTLYGSVYAMPGEWMVIDIYVSGIDFALAFTISLHKIKVSWKELYSGVYVGNY